TRRREHPNEAVVIRWHPFQLNPDLPSEGVDRKSYLEEKFGGAARAKEIYARVEDAAKNAGLAVNFEGIARQPNTLAAHALIAYAQTSADTSASDALVERLFRAYFIEGQFVGDVDVLVALGQECGFDGDVVRAVILDAQTLAQVAAQDERVRRQGISGVPFFIFNNRVALSGAHPPANLLQAIAQATA
ncbi:MAG: DsbA family oxidoreductase, partial [Casimicrobium sp.]